MSISALLTRISPRLSGLGLPSLVILLAAATYMTLAKGARPFAVEANTLYYLSLAIAGTLLILGAVILRRFFILWSALKEGSAGSRLQTRVVTVFSLVTILPTIIVSVFSALFFHYGITTWFDDRVSTALEESVKVARAYQDEHRESLRTDASSMAATLRRDIYLSAANPPLFASIVNSQTELRSLAEAIVIQGNRILVRSRLSFSLTFERLPEELLLQARQGETVLIDDEDRITAITVIDETSDTFLLISRLVDSKVIDHMEQSLGAAEQYKKLKTQITDLQWRFSIVFGLLSLLLLLAVVWYGLHFAARLVVPISKLVRATERVRAGDYSIQIETSTGDDEINQLIRRFNRMTEQLSTGRLELTQANRMLDERRRFSEAVLGGVSAGVIALDSEQAVRLYNRTAMQLLGLESEASLIGTPLADLMPAIGELLIRAREYPETLHHADLTLNREDVTLTLHVRLSTEMVDQVIEGYIVTFDDISPLLSAQRRAAWADVARRVAHEIKNPLTPIQLSVERLRKKHAPSDPEAQEQFNKYLETISRHTADIGKMVEEFVSFARMPAPKFRLHALKPLLEKAAFSAETAYPGLTIRLVIDNPATELYCDEQQIQQVFTNLLKNAVESIERHEKKTEGRIVIDVASRDGEIDIMMTDNGVGFSEDKMDRLTEPYVTTREKGTGLGLAIVKKIVEDHHGKLALSNVEQGGARVSLSFTTTVEIDSERV